MNSQRKMGFWTVTSLVAGSQIGTGIFLLPASMAAFGAAGLSSWLITALGAMLLAISLCTSLRKNPKDGRPSHFYRERLWKKSGFFFSLDLLGYFLVKYANGGDFGGELSEPNPREIFTQS